MAETPGTGSGLLREQADAGMQLFRAQHRDAAEFDKDAAWTYKADIENRIAALQDERVEMRGKECKNQRAAKGKEIQALQREQRYVDACKISRGLEPQSGGGTGLVPSHRCQQGRSSPRPTGRDPSLQIVGNSERARACRHSRGSTQRGRR